MKPRVYLDYNATAPLHPTVRSALEPLLFGSEDSGVFGNASSVHWAGREAKKHLERARRTVADLTGRGPSEVIFTSGASEADNLAIFGLLSRSPVQRLIVSAIEHPAVAEPAAQLERRGVEVVRIPVDATGQLELQALHAALATPAALVSVMAVNNETGVIQPIDAVLAAARAAGVPLHVDAVQAAGRVPLPLDAELISLSGHKLGGPKGAGVLLTRSRLQLEPRVLGGPQERGLRGGTEAVPQAVGLAVALERALAAQDREVARLLPLRDRLEAGLVRLDGVRILGSAAPRVANTTLALFEGVEAETLLHALDLEGVAASSGSACSSGSLEPSPVLLAMGVPAREALSSIRFSLGWASTGADVDRVLEVLPAVLARARASVAQ